MALTADDITLLKSQLLPAADSDLKLYAIVDAGVAGNDLLTQLNVVHQVPGLSLMPGDKRYSLKDVSPLLIVLTNQSELLEWLLREGWQNHWGIYLQTTAELSDLYHHLFTLTCVRLPDEKVVYFRYHDPRVLRPFFGALTPEQGHAFLGPIRRLFVEQEDKIKPRYYDRPQGLEEREPAPSPDSWTVLPEPWWEITQLQLAAIVYALESIFINKLIEYLKEVDPELCLNERVVRISLKKAKSLKCNTEQQYALYLTVALLYPEKYRDVEEKLDKLIFSASDSEERLDRLSNLLIGFEGQLI